MRRWHLGNLLGVEIWFSLSSLLLSGIFWLVLSGAGIIWLDFSTGLALVVGLTAVGLHWLSELAHQLGHAWVARRLGYPMSRLFSWTLLLASRYPKDEPDLHARIHIRRALGGPAISFLITALSGILLLLIPPDNRVMFTLTAFTFAENLLVFFLGAFLPLGFTDGSTLLTWWPRRHD